MNTKNIPIAVLTDCENTSHRLIKPIIAYLEKLGFIIAFIKAYADWTNPLVKRWKYELKDVSVETVQRFAYGKNSTDIIISTDAIQILYTYPNIQAFCFVSSDGDFEIPARKIKDKGLMVLAVGQKHTRQAFIKLCDKFIYTDELENLTQTAEPLLVVSQEIVNEAFDKSKDTSNNVKLSTFGHWIKQLCPGFTAQKAGFNSLSAFIKSFAPAFEIVTDSKGGLIVKRNTK